MSIPASTIASTPTDLRYSIEEAPPGIEALAESLDIGRIGYVPPRLYVSWNPKRWDQAKAERNLAQISAICDGADVIITDLEGDPRSVIRHPNEYTKTELAIATKRNFVPMWQWFRSHWPEAAISEWNLAPAKDSTRYPYAESLIIEYLDAIDISMYAQPDREIWFRAFQRILEHGRELATEHDKLLITWLWDRHKIHHDDGTIEYAPLPRSTLAEMLELAIAEGVDIAVFWTNDYRILAADDPAKLLSEVIATGDAETALPEINANVALVISEMRLHAESLTR